MGNSENNYFCIVMKHVFPYFILVFFLLFSDSIFCQSVSIYDITALERPAEKTYYFVVTGNDSIPLFKLTPVFVYGKYRFKSHKEEIAYNKLIRDVKKTLPYAKLVYNTLIETYEYMQTLPDDKSRDRHLKRMEKELFKEYKPELKKLTFSQGKLLIKLIDRECNQSSYNLLKAYLGSFRAGFWNIFAGLFGANLKTDYKPESEDKQVEIVVRMVEQGLI